MGIDYSFQIYVHRRHAADLLTAVAELCEPCLDERTTVIAPDGTVVQLPGGYDAPGGPVALADKVAARGYSPFELALCFPQDDPLRGYLDRRADDGRDVSCAWPDATVRVKVALVYLNVSDGSSLLPEHWMFDFTPATSEQSRLFLTSPSVRQTFATLALRVAAPLCLLDVEELFSIVVTGPGRPVSVQVPGPCILWDRRTPRSEAHRELLARLDDPSPAITPRWIVGPGQPAYGTFVDDLTRHAEIDPAITHGP